MIIRGSFLLKVFSFTANGLKASSILTFCLTAYEMLGLSGDADTTTGLIRPRVEFTLSLVVVVAVAVIPMM